MEASTSFEPPPGAEVCAELLRDSERALVWTTRHDRGIDFHFAALAADGTVRVGPVEVGYGGQVEPSCGLAYRDGRYAVVWPYYDDVFDHEGDLTFAKLDPVTGEPAGWRVVDETKGGDEHTVDSLVASDGGFVLRFHTTRDERPRRLDLDPDGRVRQVLATARWPSRSSPRTAPAR